MEAETKYELLRFARVCFVTTEILSSIVALESEVKARLAIAPAADV